MTRRNSGFPLCRSAQLYRRGMARPTLLFVPLCLLLFVASASSAAARYNVLYLIADDLRPEFLEAYQQKEMITPNLDAFARRALVFDNAYCQQAVCGPSRASFMTGRRPAHTNVYGNKLNFREVGKDSNGPASAWRTMPQHFKESGFLTLGGGKTFHPDHPPKWDAPHSWTTDCGPACEYFDYRYWINPNASYKGPCPGPGIVNKTSFCSDEDTWCVLDEPDDHFYDYTLANSTIRKLRFAATQQESRPFFLMAGFARPHAPWRVPQRFWDLYDSAKLSMPRHALPPENMPGVAWHKQGFFNASDGRVHVPEVTTPLEEGVTREMRHAYYAAVSWLDHQIGRVLDELERLGLANNTVVLLHGDHGWQLGEHNSWHKFTNFELGARVPLMIRVPWKTASAGARTTLFAELVDMYPTLAELVEAGKPKDLLDGTSLAPVFDEPALTHVPDTTGLNVTLDKTLAFSQFPHTDDWNCSWVRGGACFASPTVSASALISKTGDDAKVDADAGDATWASTSASGSGSGYWMGFAVRNHTHRFVMWYAASSKTNAVAWDSTPLLELYEYSTDNIINDFDGIDVVNVAYEAEKAATVQALHSLALRFFKDQLPPQPPHHAPTASCGKADSGIPSKDGAVCCPKSCGHCGGKGCDKSPGGKLKCCAGEIARAGTKCDASHPPPCVLQQPGGKVGSAAAAPSPAPSPGLDRIRAREDGFLVDSHGRVRIFHGFNDIQESKGTGHSPGGSDYLPSALAVESVLVAMEELGFNAHRTPMMWAATHPQPGANGSEPQVDGAYLDAVESIVESMAGHHQYALLDMHQDVLSSALGGYDGAPRWLVNRTTPRHAFPWPLKEPFKSWGDGYLTEATGQSFQDIYDDVHGGLTDWKRFWRDVAMRFQSHASILGYELINEPWPGDDFKNPLLLLPGVAGARSLSKSYAALTEAIRAVDNTTAIFFEPTTWGMLFPGAGVAGSGFERAPDPNSVLAFHYYCWFAAGKNDTAKPSALTKLSCDGVLGPEVFRAVAADVTKLRVPSMMTEWGGKTPKASEAKSLGTVEINRVLDEAEKHLTSWTFYDFCSLLPHNGREYANVDLSNDAALRDILRVFARPYAQAVAGIPTKMENTYAEDADGAMQGETFTLEYMRDVAITAPTEIAVPPLWFPSGYTVELSPGLTWALAEGRRNIVAVTAGPASEPVLTTAARVTIRAAADRRHS